MPLSIAMAATDTPSSRLRATKSRLNSVLCSRRRRGALTTCLSMMCITGLMHTVAGALDQLIVLTWSPIDKRALKPRLRYFADPIESFDGLTAEVLVLRGRARDVLRYIESLQAGASGWYRGGSACPNSACRPSGAHPYRCASLGNVALRRSHLARYSLSHSLASVVCADQA